MLVKSTKNGWTWYQGVGLHPSCVGCCAEGREQCDCTYHITDGTIAHSFSDYQEAETKWNELTDSQSFQLGKTVW